MVGALARLGSALDAGISSILPAGIRSARSLGAENQELRKRLDILTAESADREMLRIENEELKTLLGRGNEEKIVYAAVIKRPPDSPYDTFILDAGSELGIKSGDTVVFGSVVVGEIIEAGRGFSKAELFSSSGNSFQGVLGSDVAIEAKGLGGGAFEALLPLGAEVFSGEPVVLPSISSRIFGSVQKIEEKREAGFKRILFAMPVNPNQIDAVGVVIQ